MTRSGVLDIAVDDELPVRTGRVRCRVVKTPVDAEAVQQRCHVAEPGGEVGQSSRFGADEHEACTLGHRQGTQAHRTAVDGAEGFLSVDADKAVAEVVGHA